MNFAGIIEVFATLIVALGGFEGIKYGINKRSEKRKASAEADKVIIETQDAKYQGVNNEYQKIIESQVREIDNLKEQLESAQRHNQNEGEMIEELQEKMLKQVSDAQEQITVKQSKIEELMDEINDLTSKLTAYSLLRCDCVFCNQRKPPLSDGAALNFVNGVLETE